MGKRIIRLTESDLNRIVAESMSTILNETSTKKLANACVGAHDKARNAREKYGNGSNRHEAAKGQLQNFQDEWFRRYKEGNVKKKARMDQEMDDAYTARSQANQKKVKESIDEIQGLHGYHGTSPEGLQTAAGDWKKVALMRFKRALEAADETSIPQFQKALQDLTTGARFYQGAKDMY